MISVKLIAFSLAAARAVLAGPVPNTELVSHQGAKAETLGLTANVDLNSSR
jgi:hypothetical protein